MGTKIHSAIEGILHGDYSIEKFKSDPDVEEISWACNEFLQWKEGQTGFEVQAVEGAVASNLGYAGTFDFISGGTLFDIKTGRTSITAGYQLAAYRYAFEEAGVDVTGMSVLNISVRDHKVNQFNYQHYDFCLQRFLSIFEAWKGLNYKKLDAIQYPWLHEFSPSKVFTQEGKRRIR